MGGSSGSTQGITSTGGTSTTSGTGTTTAQLSPEQQQALGLAMPWMQQFGTTGLSSSAVPQVAGFTPSQMQGQTMALNAAGGQAPIVESAGQGSQFLTSGAALSPSSNPALQESINAAVLPIQQNLTESTLPAIREAATGVGQIGSSREGIAEGLATRGAEQAEGAVSADLANKNYQAGLSAMVNALTSAPTVAGAQTMPASTTSAVGDVQQQQQQKELDYQAAVNAFNQMSPEVVASLLGSFASGIPGGGVTTTGTGTTTGQGLSTTQSQSNPSLASLLTGGASAAGGFATGLSDILPFLGFAAA